MGSNSVLFTCFTQPNRKGLIISKSYKRSLQIQQNIMNDPMAKDGVFNTSHRELRFLNGSTLKFSHLSCDCDLNKFHSIRIDEFDPDDLDIPHKIALESFITRNRV